MAIISLTLELVIEQAHSLKDRRQVVRSLKEKLRHGFNISVAELDEAVTWQSFRPYAAGGECCGAHRQ
jgi:uncharacterized protein YlxP (DUF503 family)